MKKDKKEFIKDFIGALIVALIIAEIPLFFWIIKIRFL